MTGPGPLSGCTVVVTARSAVLADSLRWRGATVLNAPTVQILPAADEAGLIETTLRVISNAPDDVLIGTATALRQWLTVAADAGLAANLLAVLDQARLVVRGRRTRAAVRALGLRPAFCDTTEGLVRRLVDQGVAGRKIVVLQGVRPDHDPLDALRSAGASVRGLRPERVGPAPDPAAVERAINQLCAGVVDAVVHTSAVSAQALLDAASLTDRLPRLLLALRSPRVLNACTSPITAAPLYAVGLDPLIPVRRHPGSLVRAVTDQLAHDRAPAVDTAFGRLVLRGGGATLAGAAVSLGPGPRAVLAALMAARGQVVSRPELLAVLPGAEDAHTVEVTVNRLRRALGRPELVRTVVRRGYRLAVANQAGWSAPVCG